MKSQRPDEMTPSIRSLGYIISSSNAENIDLALFHGVLSAIDNQLVPDQSVTILKELLWSLSNITAGTEN
jgi:hypothetical protein